MPHCYFHFQNGVTTLDDVGFDTPDISAAKTEAIRNVAIMLHEDPMHGLCNGESVRVWVTDGPGGTGATLFSLRVVPEE
jgi:hypothetical protein